MTATNKRRLTVSLLLFCLLATFHRAATAHEFWLEPVHWNGNGTLMATFYNGEGFSGERVRVQAENTIRLDVHHQGQTTGVDLQHHGEVAHNITVPTLPAGVSVIAYESTPALHRYKHFKDFKSFTVAEGLGWAVDRHRQRQLPDAYFSEIVKRYTKTLVCKGQPKGFDDVLGLDVELTAQFNPFEQTVEAAHSVKTGSLGRVQLKIDHRAAGTRQISLFHRDTAGQVNLSTLTTDRNGFAEVPRFGAGDYLLNAVDLRAPTLRESLRSGAVWESRWSTLLFSVGKRCATEPDIHQTG